MKRGFFRKTDVFHPRFIRVQSVAGESAADVHARLGRITLRIEATHTRVFRDLRVEQDDVDIVVKTLRITSRGGRTGWRVRHFKVDASRSFRHEGAGEITLSYRQDLLYQ